MLDGTVCYFHNASLAPKAIIGSCKTWKKQVMDWYQSRTKEWQPSLSVIYKTGLLKLGWASAVRLLDISLNLTFLTILLLKGLEPNSPPSVVSLSLIPLTPLCLFLLILKHKNPKIGAVTNIEAFSGITSYISTGSRRGWFVMVLRHSCWKGCPSSWMHWSASLIQSSAAVLTSSIEPMFDTFWLWFVFLVKTTIWTLLTAVRDLNKEVSLITCFIATCVRYPGATGRCYLMRGTLLTVFTRGRVKLGRKPAWRAFFAKYFGFFCKLCSTWRIQSQSGGTFVTRKAPLKAPVWVDNSVLVNRTDFTIDVMYFLARRKRRTTCLVAMVCFMPSLTRLPNKRL